MFTDTVQHRTMTSPQPATGLLARTVGQVRQFICGLHGHDALLHFGQGRMSLQCTSCGYESPGWDVNTEPERAIVKRAKHRLVHMPLVRQRRVA
jgi:hypothetical protein